MFNTLHLMFETQYDELALAVDQIAERIHALVIRRPAGSAQYAKLSLIKESEDKGGQAVNSSSRWRGL